MQVEICLVERHCSSGFLQLAVIPSIVCIAYKRSTIVCANQGGPNVFDTFATSKLADKGPMDFLPNAPQQQQQHHHHLYSFTVCTLAIGAYPMDLDNG
jgi:hypothetical protein